jgi:SAM-dependent methyltransferase
VTGSDPTQRFTDRVADYARSRPSYPLEALDILAREAHLAPGAAVADVGSGTGILTELLLGRGFRVFAVEPNRAMAEAAEARLGRHPGFRSVPGTAEETTLEPASVGLAVAAQAFHWFDPARARAEFRRILEPPGHAAILWNMRRRDGTRFLADYEALLQRWGMDYREVAARHGSGLEAFFGGRVWRKHVLPYRQEHDRGGLRSRLVSSSYTPAEGHPSRAPMLEALDALFDRHAVDGRVALEYDTEIYAGELG